MTPLKYITADDKWISVATSATDNIVISTWNELLLPRGGTAPDKIAGYTLKKTCTNYSATMDTTVGTSESKIPQIKLIVNSRCELPLRSHR